MSNRNSRRAWEGLEQLETRQVLAAISWDGGGGDFAWNNPLNWSGDVLPGAADDVVIDVSGTPTILHNQGATENIHSLRNAEALHLSAGTINVAANWDQEGAMTMSGGRIDGTGDVNMGGSFLWTAGTIAGGGKFHVVTGHATTLAGNVELDRSLDNAGNLIWDSGNLVTGSGVMITNLPGKTMLLRSTGVMSGAGILNNLGILSRNGVANTTSTVGIRFENQPGNISQGIGPGTVVAHRGTLSFTGVVGQKNGDTLTGGKWIVSSSDGRLLLPGGDIAHVVGTPGAMLPRITLIGAAAAFPQLESAQDISVLTLSGGRQFTFANLTQLTLLQLIGTMTVPHSLNTDQLVAIGGQAGGEIVMAQGVSARSIYTGLNTTLSLGGTSEVHDSMVFGPGLVRVAGDLNWTSGIITGQGQMLITPTGRLLMAESAAAGDRMLSRRTINQGTIDWNDGTHAFTFARELVNRGTFQVRATNGFLNAGGFAILQNFGTINTYDDVTFRPSNSAAVLSNNVGTIHAIDGALIVNGGATGGGAWQVDGGSEIAFGNKAAILNGAQFSGDGRVRVANNSAWNSSSMTGGGDLLVGTAGNLSLSGDSTTIARSAVTNNGEIHIAPGDTVRVQSNFTNSGLLDLDTGRLVITGNMTMTPGSDLTVHTIDASTIGTIDVSGLASLDGALNVNFDWVPSMGANLNFFTVGSHTGNFSTVTANGLPPDKSVTFSFTGNTGGFTVTGA